MSAPAPRTVNTPFVWLTLPRNPTVPTSMSSQGGGGPGMVTEGTFDSGLGLLTSSATFSAKKYVVPGTSPATATVCVAPDGSGRGTPERRVAASQFDSAIGLVSKR